MGYKELDLFQLFREVTAYGGFNEVVKNVGTWSKIWKRLGNFDPSITDSSFRLKKNYERYLLDYEFKCFPDNRRQAIEFDKQLQLKRSPSQTGQEGGFAAMSLDSPTNTTTWGSRLDKPKSKKNKKKSSTFGLLTDSSQSELKEIARELDGAPKLPLVLGDLTIECLGVIIARSPYITEKHIWPVGFKSSRYFSSMHNPDVKVKYTSQIIDAGDRPQFVVTASDDLVNPIISHSPSSCWRTVLKRVMSKQLNSDIKKNVSVSGTMRFGLAHQLVSLLIRELPNADLYQDLDTPDSPDWTPDSSPTLDRKQKKRKSLLHSSSGSSSSSEDYFDNDSSDSYKEAKYSDEETYFAKSRNSQWTREEWDDLENAVATLQALKYCAVY